MEAIRVVEIARIEQGPESALYIKVGAMQGPSTHAVGRNLVESGQGRSTSITEPCDGLEGPLNCRRLREQRRSLHL